LEVEVEVEEGGEKGRGKGKGKEKGKGLGVEGGSSRKKKSGGGEEGEDESQSTPTHPNWLLAFLHSVYLYILRYVCRQRNERGHFGHYPIIFSNVSTHTPLDLTGIRLNEGRRLMAFLRGAAIATQPWFPSAAPFWLVASSLGELVGLFFAYPLLMASSQRLIFLPLLAVSSFNHVTGVVCTLSPSSCYSTASTLGGVLIAVNCLLCCWLAYFPLAVWWKIMAPHGCPKLSLSSCCCCCNVKRGEGGDDHHHHTDPPHKDQDKVAGSGKGGAAAEPPFAATSKRAAQPSPPPNPSVSHSRREGLKKPSVRAVEEKGSKEEDDALTPVFNAPRLVVPNLKRVLDSKRDVPTSASSRRDVPATHTVAPTSNLSPSGGDKNGKGAGGESTSDQLHHHHHQQQKQTGVPEANQHHGTHAVSLGPSPGKGGTKVATPPPVHHKKDSGGSSAPELI
jgi:hypothetical protein